MSAELHSIYGFLMYVYLFRATYDIVVMGCGKGHLTCR